MHQTETRHRPSRREKLRIIQEIIGGQTLIYYFPTKVGDVGAKVNRAGLNRRHKTFWLFCLKIFYTLVYVIRIIFVSMLLV